ncbi:MAG: gliding motility protein GldN [Bacteroidales bacterium]
MKIVKIGLLACSLFIGLGSAVAQGSAAPVVNMDSLIFNQSPRMLAITTEKPQQDIRWSKTLYRLVSLTDSASIAQNGYLGEPRTPIQYFSEAGGAKQKRYYYNLISVILRLLDEQKIPAYIFDTQAVDESFSAEEALTPDSALMKLGLVRSNKAPKFDRADFTFAGSGITGYLIKEQWYFDARGSQFASRVVAIAPVMSDLNSSGEFTPAFWITYESIQPYLSQLAMMSESGSATFDSFFRKRSYNGLIYKVQNSGNQSLWAKCTYEADPHACRVEQSKKVEEELKSYMDSFWAKPVKSVENTQNVGVSKKKLSPSEARKERIEQDRARKATK